jgi:hypothetical protein
MRFLFAAIPLLSFDPASFLAGDDNPYKDAKVGDWVEYKYTGKARRLTTAGGRATLTSRARVRSCAP